MAIKQTELEIELSRLRLEIRNNATNIVNGNVNNVNNGHIHNGNVNNNYVLNNAGVLVQIVPFDPHSTIPLSAKDVTDICEGNPQFGAFTGLSPEQQLEYSATKNSAPCAHLLIDVMRKEHEQPETRNVRINPNRADMALVWKGREPWIHEYLATMSSQLANRAANSIWQACIRHLSLLPAEISSGIGFLNAHYRDHPEDVDSQVKKLLVPHLKNIEPLPALQR